MSFDTLKIHTEPKCNKICRWTWTIQVEYESVRLLEITSQNSLSRYGIKQENINKNRRPMQTTRTHTLSQQ